ncbi:MAG: ABC transporter permease [Gammaproteobacteria bacterium]|nr:ABC transporter permease [Gammaproteobacteria bacterium]
MNNYLRGVALIARRDLLESISTKVFWIGALLGPILIVVVMVVVGILTAQTAVSKGQYAVIDHSEGLGDEIRNEILRSDLQQFVSAIAFRSGIDEELLAEIKRDALANAKEESELIDSFVESTLPYLSFPESNRRNLSGGVLPARFASWWSDNQELVMELVPGLSFERYVERKPGDTFTEEQLNTLVESEELLGYVVIPEDLVQTSENARFVTKNFLKADVAGWYENFATNVVRRYRVAEANIPEADAQWVVQPVSFAMNKTVTQDQPTADGSESGSEIETESVSADAVISRFAPAVYQYVLWFMVFFGSVMLMTGTVEEKSTKLVEVLLSNADAGQLMDGKLLGIAATMLTVIGVWLVLIGTPVLLGAVALPAVLPFEIDIVGAVFKPVYVLNFIVFLVMGFMFFGYLFSAVGSVCTSIRDAQTLSAPISVVLIVPVMLIVPLAMDPSGPLALALKFFPPYTPFVMMNTAAELPALPVYLLIIVWMVAWTWASRWAAARIYKKGMLIESKPQGFKGLVRLVRS